MEGGKGEEGRKAKMKHIKEREREMQILVSAGGESRYRC